MTIGIVVFISLAGTTVGIMAALAGGAVEQSFMRFLDVVLAIPSMVLVLVMVSIFGNGIVTTTIAIMSVSWITYARISHSLVLEFRESNFIKQAHMGASDPYVSYSSMFYPMYSLILSLLLPRTLAISCCCFLPCPC